MHDHQGWQIRIQYWTVPALLFALFAASHDCLKHLHFLTVVVMDLCYSHKDVPTPIVGSWFLFTALPNLLQSR